MRGNPKLRLSLRVVFYREDGVWMAHCLETNLLGDGETKQEAMKSLCQAIVIQLEASVEWNNLDNFFSPAEGKYFQMFARGKDVDKAVMALSFDRLRIEDGEFDEVVGREYEDSGHLVPA